MTYYLGKVLSSCKDLYNDVNAAYLTGAIDIIVIKQKDGSLKSTPFHVRFGKLGVLRTGDLKEIELEVNGEVVDLHMKVDESGRGFFSKKKVLEAISESDAERDHIALDMENPLPPDPHSSHRDHSKQVKHNSNSALIVQHSSLKSVKSQSVNGSNAKSNTPPREGVEVKSVSDGSPSANQEESILLVTDKSTPIRESGNEKRPRSSSLPVVEEEVMSDSALDQQWSGSLRSEASLPTPGALSDTEVEVKDRLSSKLWEWSARRRHTTAGETSSSDFTGYLEHDSMKPQPVDRPGFWSALTGILKRRSNRRRASMEGGMYLDDIDYDSMDPDELSKFFPNSSVPIDTTLMDQTGSSGLGSSPALSPAQSSYDMFREENSRLLSLLDNCAFSLCGGLAKGNITEEQFYKAQISYPDFSADPAAVFSNPNLVVRVNNKYYNWQTASALVLSSIAFLQVLPDPAQDVLAKKLMPKKIKQRSSWFLWGRWSKVEEDDQSKVKSEGSTTKGPPRKWDPNSSVSSKPDILSSDEEQETTKHPVRPRQRSLKRKKTGFTPTPSAEELATLPLKHGANTVVFSITTKYQGTTKAQCTLYLWNYFDKIVVSDIDGTITRSDVAGQVLPFLGKDWTQNGVVELYKCISHNGYHIMYLSARAIGQAGYTKEFLRNVKRGSLSLPDGPLFLVPFSLYIAFKKEVIERKPEEFKIECLKQIRNLFPEDYNPFHAGFGNKPSDALSYIQVRIPEARIFTVNTKGHIRYRVSTSYKSNYMDLSHKWVVDAQFPPLKFTHTNSLETDSVTNEEDVEANNVKEHFSTFNYWRTNLESMYAYLPEQTPQPTLLLFQ